MKYIPNELINLILSYVERPVHYKILEYVIEKCYKEDYHPYDKDFYYDMYSFNEWYFINRR
jgi:hypothetical protein